MLRILFALIFSSALLSCHNSEPERTTTTVVAGTTENKTTEPHSKFILNVVLPTDTAGADTAAIIKDVMTRINDYKRTARSFPKDTFNFFDKTSEGGEAIITEDSVSGLTSIEGSIMAEQGKIEYAYYLSGHNELVLAVFTDYSYDKPISEQGSKVASTTTTYQVFNKGFTVAALDGKMKKLNMSNDVLLSKDRETKEFFNEYIGQIKVK